MFKKLVKIISTILLILLLLISYFSIVRPAYINYKLNKKEIVVDTSGERATSKNKIKKENTKNKEKEKTTTSENAFKVEKKEYDSVIFDDRILQYHGEVKPQFMKGLVDVLLEDANGNSYSKVDIVINGVDGVSSDLISFKDNNEQYVNTLNTLKESINDNNIYNVEFEYNSIKSVVKKIIITQN